MTDDSGSTWTSGTAPEPEPTTAPEPEPEPAPVVPDIPEELGGNPLTNDDVRRREHPDEFDGE